MLIKLCFLSLVLMTNIYSADIRCLEHSQPVRFLISENSSDHISYNSAIIAYSCILLHSDSTFCSNGYYTLTKAGYRKFRSKKEIKSCAIL